MRHFIDLERWQIEIVCQCTEVIQGLKSIFDFRLGALRLADKPLLSCSISCADDDFCHRIEKIKFEGPRIDVSPGVVIQYGFDGPITWLKVTQTAVIAFDSRRPDKCRVWLTPPDSAANQGQHHLTPCPEAFIYPMLAEWLRAVDACLVHCGAVVVNGRAVVLSGPPGSGKSTHVLRMLLAGADFLADDLAVLYRKGQYLFFNPLREVANVHEGSTAIFPELAFIGNAPRRGDHKFMVNVPRYFQKKAAVAVPAGVLLRLHPDSESWIKPCPHDQSLDHLHRMAWFASRPEGNKNHFWLLTDWLMSCEQWHVSQGYLAEEMDALMTRLCTSPGPEN